MQLDLNIKCNSPSELASVLALLGAGGVGSATAEPTDDGEDASEEAIAAARNSDAEAPAKPRRGRGKKAQQEQAPAVPTQDPVTGEPLPPVEEPIAQPTPGGTKAPPAESIPPNQQADVFGGGEASTGQPAATAATGEVDLNALKSAMADLLRVKSAAFAMKTLEDATGCKSLSSGSPSVIEKAKDDPAIMQRALDALVAGKDAPAA